MSDEAGMMDSGPLTQHYTLLIIFTLSERGRGEQQHKDEKEEWRRKTKKDEEERGSGDKGGGLESHK